MYKRQEYAKLAVVVLLAAIVSRNASHMKSWKYMFLVILLILPVVGLVGSNNLSTAIIILGIAVILIFVANPQFLPFLWIGGTGVGLSLIHILRIMDNAHGQHLWIIGWCKSKK